MCNTLSGGFRDVWQGERVKICKKSVAYFMDSPLPMLLCVLCLRMLMYCFVSYVLIQIRKQFFKQVWDKLHYDTPEVYSLKSPSLLPLLFVLSIIVIIKHHICFFVLKIVLWLHYQDNNVIIIVLTSDWSSFLSLLLITFNIVFVVFVIREYGTTITMIAIGWRLT